MGLNQLSREELQTVALDNCPAELFYELNDQMDEVDEGMLSVLAEHKVEDGLTPYLLGRLAFWQEINNVTDDTLMMDFLEGDRPSGVADAEYIQQWAEGRCREEEASR